MEGNKQFIRVSVYDQPPETPLKKGLQGGFWLKSIKLTLEEQVLTDCLDWAQDEEDWEEKTATHIATGVFDLTGQRIAPNRVSSTLKKMGYSKDTSPKKWRMLDGYSLYNIPRFVSKPNIFNLFEEKGKMGRDK